MKEDIRKEFDAIDDIALVEKGSKRRYRRVEQEVIDRQAEETGRFKMMELSNRMKILLIEDETVRRSSASLTVQAGHWHDPKTYPGMARLCELMVFGQMDDRVEIFGSTEDTETNFYFESESDAFMGALEQFSRRLARDDIFNEDDIKSKIDQVDQMYKTSSWKLGNLYSLLADKNHPASKFQGSVRSLRKKGVFDALKHFYRDHYSSNTMTLAIRTDKNIDQLEAWIVRESDFALIKNKNHKPQDFQHIGAPLLENKASVVKIKDASDFDVILDYQLPGKHKYTKTKPLHFIDYMLSSS